MRISRSESEKLFVSALGLTLMGAFSSLSYELVIPIAERSALAPVRYRRPGSCASLRGLWCADQAGIIAAPWCIT